MFKAKHPRPTLKRLLPDRADRLPPLPFETAPVPSRLALFAALFAYLLFAAPTVYLALQAYTPCETDFEGGCGMGHMLLAVGSFVTAGGAWAFGVPLARAVMRRSHAARRSAMAFAVRLLWALPMLYILSILVLLLIVALA
jgi:hypothetical protein